MRWKKKYPNKKYKFVSSSFWFSSINTLIFYIFNEVLIFFMWVRHANHSLCEIDQYGMKQSTFSPLNISIFYSNIIYIRNKNIYFLILIIRNSNSLSRCCFYCEILMTCWLNLYVNECVCWPIKNISYIHLKKLYSLLSLLLNFLTLYFVIPYTIFLFSFNCFTY